MSVRVSRSDVIFDCGESQFGGDPDHALVIFAVRRTEKLGLDAGEIIDLRLRSLDLKMDSLFALDRRQMREVAPAVGQHLGGDGRQRWRWPRARSSQVRFGFESDGLV